MRCAQKAIVSLLLLLFARGAQAQAVGQPAHRADSDCSSCHGDKTSGKVVHPAMAMGCAVCHRVVAHGKTTTVDLTVPREQICFTCHVKSEDEYQHPPYANGRCVSCHDPHSSDYPMHLRAEVNTLCLRCHAPQGLEGEAIPKASNQPRPESDSQVSKFGSALQAIHHSSERFLALMSALQTEGTPVTCISCHLPHSSPDSKLLLKAFGTGR
jgi:predicted CXXCH cytochrome family protein